MPSGLQFPEIPEWKKCQFAPVQVRTKYTNILYRETYSTGIVRHTRLIPGTVQYAENPHTSSLALEDLLETYRYRDVKRQGGKEALIFFGPLALRALFRQRLTAGLQP
jgi:hypothetical protein